MPSRRRRYRGQPQGLPLHVLPLWYERLTSSGLRSSPHRLPLHVLTAFLAVVVATPPGAHDVAAQEAAQGAAVLTAERLVSLRRVSDVALDPAGERVAYTLVVPRDASEDPGRARSELWMVDVEAPTPRRLSAEHTSVSAPAWSPDGSYLSFLSRRDPSPGSTQIYLLPMAGGEARRLEHDTSVSAYRWSPDGQRIAFVAADPESETRRTAREEGRDWIVVDADPVHQRLWVADVESGEATELYDEPLTTFDFDWTPDGASLVVRAAATPRIDDSMMFSDLYLVPAAGGAPEQLVDAPGKLGPPLVGPDGSLVAYAAAVSQNDPLAQNLFVAPLDGGAPANLTEGMDGSALSVRWLDDGRLVAAIVTGTTSGLQIITPDGDARTPLFEGQAGAVQAFDAASGRLAIVAHTREHPPELYLGSITGSTLERVTHSNPELDTLRLARQETIEWPAADGRTIQGVLTYPLDYQEGTPAPLVLQIHGGPEGVSLDGWTSSALYPVQLLAAHGYAVLEPNYRGSAGRGVAFSTADHDDLGGAEFEDVLAGIDALAARGIIDPERVGTGGWSYGGYFSALAATRYSERFRAAFVAAGISNWVSFTGTTDIPYEMSLVHWDQWWYDDPALHWDRSPLAHLDAGDTPTLIVHGQADDRVHPAQSLELYTSMRLLEVPVELVLYPREPHGLLERAHQIDFAERTIAWFDKYVKGEGKP